MLTKKIIFVCTHVLIKFSSPMSIYFLHIDGRQVGPYSKEELQQIRISRDTMIWFEGQEQWQEAGTVDALSDLFRNQPPPFKKKQGDAPVHPNPIQTEEPVRNKATGKLKSSTLASIIIGGVVFLLGIYMVYNNQQAKEQALQQELELKQKELHEQRELMQARELAHQEEEAKRIAEEERAKQLQKLTFRYNQAVDKVEEAKLKLEKIKEFHFLRTFSEKEEQINTQMDIIKAWENEVIRLKAQLNQR